MKKTMMTIAAIGGAMTVMAMETIDLNGLWDFRFENRKPLEEVQLGGFEANDKMTVPGAWDAMTHYYNQRGTGCYRRTFELKGDAENAYLVVDGMALRAKFAIDGRDIGTSALPWSKFELETGALKEGKHTIEAAVDSIVDEKRVKLFRNFYDFYAFGGFQHGLKLEVQRKPVELRRIAVRTRDYKTGLVELETIYAGKGAAEDFEAEVRFDEGAATKVAFRGRKAQVKVPNFRLWTHHTPNLHTVEIDGVKARFGVRQVGTAKGRVTLNGEPVYLKGVNRHEAHYEFGSTTPKQLMYEDIRNVKDLGGNFIRGCHYAQCEEFLDLCDELGVLVWEESLGWGNRKEQLKDEEFCRLQEEETRLMVRNSINHPCIIISAFLNEPNSEVKECLTLVNRLVEVIRAEDTGHLITFASCHADRDICHVNTDIIAYNTYPCWYGYPMPTGSHEEMRENIRACHEKLVKYYREKFHDDRPIIVSETGVKADYGARDPRGKAQYTEDYQEEYTRTMLQEVFAQKEIAGIAIWQFTDAKTYTRVHSVTSRSYGVNTGGLYDLYRRPKLAVEAVRDEFTAKAEK